MRYTAGVEVHWIDTDDALRSWCDRLASEERIAVDTESNSMFAYFERICLVQISTASVDLLVDPLAVDLAPLGALLEDASVQKVLHGADYDVLSFKRSLGFRICNLFDTMIAARVLGWPKCGLAALLSEHFDHAANKAFQRYDWGQRPLSSAALEYARYDTHYLLGLSALQTEALEASPHLELFERACTRQCAVEPRTKPFDPDGYYKIKGARDLDEASRAILKAAFAWRDQKARELDRPPFRVMPESAMLGLARSKPADVRALGHIKGMPRPVTRRDGPALVELVAAALSASCPKPSRNKSPADRDLGHRMDALKAWRKREAQRLGVEPEIILDKASLLAVAVAGAVEALGVWERERYGSGMAAALQAAQS